MHLSHNRYFKFTHLPASQHSHIPQTHPPTKFQTTSTANMRTAVLLFAIAAVLAATVQAGNPSLSTPGSNAVTKCLKGKLKNGQCVSKLRVRQVGSDEWLEIPEAADAQWDTED
ncbi:hypothetical protein B0A48_03902 [Cryoendolithus antarcticus]|uniref:Uncharacterized protein n=1 Tax=Cryoendolithus antarcticus TaxID=1507870 RepID=A0A1V8TH43_9PEZI|nr:hypothetical protein B0A48_03902 [Cryoendolithus antarcticus]